MDWKTAYGYIGNIVDVTLKNEEHVIGHVDDIDLDDYDVNKNSLLIDEETTSFPSKDRIYWDLTEVLLNDVADIKVIE